MNETETIVLLHGFGATRRGWDPVAAQLGGERYRPLALDLPGHGAASGVRPITFHSCARHVLDHSPERFALAGYSMGGRIALHVALAAPRRVSRLVLVSTTAGLDEYGERAARRDADEQLAQSLERDSYEDFIEAWRSQPLFAQDPPEVSRVARSDQRRNRPSDLAVALRGVGTGRMLPLWDRLRELTMPVLVLTGERDARYGKLGERLAGALPAAELRVLPGGHALALESPAAVAGAILAFAGQPASQEASMPRPGVSGTAS